MNVHPAKKKFPNKFKFLNNNITARITFPTSCIEIKLKVITVYYKYFCLVKQILLNTSPFNKKISSSKAYILFQLHSGQKLRNLFIRIIFNKHVLTRVLTMSAILDKTEGSIFVCDLTDCVYCMHTGFCFSRIQQAQVENPKKI